MPDSEQGAELLTAVLGRPTQPISRKSKVEVELIGNSIRSCYSPCILYHFIHVYIYIYTDIRIH